MFQRAAVRLPRDGRGPGARRAWPVTKMHRPQLQAFSALPGGDGRGSRRRIAFWGPVLRTGAAPQSDGHRGTNLKINKNSPREPGLILTLSREAWGWT